MKAYESSEALLQKIQYILPSTGLHLKTNKQTPSVRKSLELFRVSIQETEEP